MTKKVVEKICEFCGKEFLASKGEVKRGYGRFCTRSCSSRRPRPQTRNRVKLKCALCKKEFERMASKKNNSKSGLFFCKRKCKDKAQRIQGGIKEIQPPHYKTGYFSYRNLAFRNFPNKCNRCGYNKIPEILQVHHKDCNRSNNNLSNLEILCSRCHDEYHFLTKTAKWSSRNGDPGNRTQPDTLQKSLAPLEHWPPHHR